MLFFLSDHRSELWPVTMGAGKHRDCIAYLVGNCDLGCSNPSQAWVSPEVDKRHRPHAVSQIDGVADTSLSKTRGVVRLRSLRDANQSPLTVSIFSGATILEWEP